MVKLLFAEHAMVRLTREWEAEGCHVAANAEGAWSSSMATGAAYMVEVKDTTGKTMVLTLPAHVLAQAVSI
jgi:hypothetical protein